MPLYDYRCTACGHALEAIQKMNDAPLTDCPACGKSTLEKQISAAAFRLKGGGWYETDFKHGKKKNLHESNKTDTKKEPVKKAPKSDKSATGS